MKSIQDQKLKDILFSAKELFWKYGFKRVSVEEVCKEANVSKMTFYKHFANKKDLVKQLYNYVIAETMDEYISIMESNIPFNEKVKKSIDLKMKYTEKISKEFYEDLIKSDDSEIIDMVNKSQNESVQVVLNDYIKAQQKGEIRQNIKPEFIFYFLNHLLDMAKDENLSAIYSTPNEMIMELINFFFYGVLPRKNE